ncbi:MAG: alpha/beta hydrolase [Nitrospinae bacterium]|nr:alpha/beta hydrolase [Nitrospinota bacterium]
MSEQRLSFPAGPLQLEGRLALPEEPNTAKAAVICHPHPQYGGDMHNHVVTAVAQELVRRGIAALRFNFRGVGTSQGSYGQGIEEPEDVRSAIEFLAQTEFGSQGEIYLVGYSFGALVGLRVAVEEERIRGWAGIAPPVDYYDLSFLKGDPKPKLLICGDHDAFCQVSSLERLFAGLKEPKSMAVIPGADHFFVGREAAVAQRVGEFLWMG